MSASNDNVPSGPTVAQTPVDQPSGNFVFVFPPPPTVWIQFNDGVRMAFTPTPAQYLQFVIGSGDINGNGSESFARVLNQLFQRAQAQPQGPPPTSKSFLDKLPVAVWRPDMPKTYCHTECVICLSEYEESEEVLSLPCGHAFHKTCGMTWLVEHNVCPTCRYELPTQESKALVQETGTQTTAEVEPPATAELENEPMLLENANVTGVRRLRPTEAVRPRDVRQRVESVTSVNEATLDEILEEEADRFVREELQKYQVAADDQDAEIDRDVEEFLNETSCSR